MKAFLAGYYFWIYMNSCGDKDTPVNLQERGIRNLSPYIHTRSPPSVVG
jgi:hypothetical protein